MGKSLGNVVNPMDFAGRYGVDPFRYFLMAEMSLGQDAAFTEEAFVRRYNADLANDLGNLLSRVVTLIGAHCDGRVPEPGPLGADEGALRDATLAAAAGMMDAVERMRLDQGMAAVAAAVREANRYLERRQPWTLAKRTDPDSRIALCTALYCAAETLRIVSGIHSPVMPGKMAELRATLGLADEKPDFTSLTRWGGLRPGAKVTRTAGLFPRIEPAKSAPVAVPGVPAVGAPPAQPAPAAAGVAKPAAEVGVALIEYADFQKVQLRTARILTAERVQGADKLLRLTIEIGEEKRQIVAGIAQHYAPETLPGRAIVVVSNLKPAKIRGIESNGMLLAASAGGVLRLVTVDGELPSGAGVK
jgi:methionyl-tRNA synthetase